MHIYGHCRLRLKKYIAKKLPDRLIFRPNPGKTKLILTKRKKILKKITDSIIGPAKAYGDAIIFTHTSEAVNPDYVYNGGIGDLSASHAQSTESHFGGTCAHTHTRTYADTHTRTHTHTHTRTHARTHPRTHAHMIILYI